MHAATHRLVQYLQWNYAQSYTYQYLYYDEYRNKYNSVYNICYLISVTCYRLKTLGHWVQGPVLKGHIQITTVMVREAPTTMMKCDRMISTYSFDHFLKLLFLRRRHGLTRRSYHCLQIHLLSTLMVLVARGNRCWSLYRIPWTHWECSSGDPH